MTGQCDITKIVIMAVVGVEVPVRLPLPSPIIWALCPSAASTLFRLPALFISSLPSSQAAPSSAPLSLRELLTPFCHPAMVSWYHSDVSQSCLEGLVKCGLLCPRSTAEEWLVHGREEFLALRNGYVVSFAHFHKRRFGTPPHPFFPLSVRDAAPQPE
jgi:hypothetical protein